MIDENTETMEKKAEEKLFASMRNQMLKMEFLVRYIVWYIFLPSTLPIALWLSSDDRFEGWPILVFSLYTASRLIWILYLFVLF